MNNVKRRRRWDLNPKAKLLLAYLNYLRQKKGLSALDRETLTLEEALHLVADESGYKYNSLKTFYSSRSGSLGRVMAQLWYGTDTLVEALNLMDHEKAWYGTNEEQSMVQENSQLAYFLLKVELEKLLAEDLKNIAPARVEHALLAVRKITSAALYHVDVRDSLAGEEQIYKLADLVLKRCDCRDFLLDNRYAIDKNHVLNGLGSSLWTQRTWVSGFPTPPLSKEDRNGILSPLEAAYYAARRVQERYLDNPAIYREMVDQECVQIRSLASWECGFGNYTSVEDWLECLKARFNESSYPDLQESFIEQIEVQTLWQQGADRGGSFLAYVEELHETAKDSHGEFHAITVAYRLWATEIKARKTGRVKKIPSECQDFLRSHPRLVSEVVDFDRYRWTASEGTKEMDKRLIIFENGAGTNTSQKLSWLL